MHWWYLPDSYDEWISKEYAPDQIQLDVPPSSGPWKVGEFEELNDENYNLSTLSFQVYLRWVYDSERFNEWMNPTDYETKEAQEEQEPAPEGGGTGDFVARVVIALILNRRNRPIIMCLRSHCPDD